MSRSNRSGDSKALDWAFPLTGIVLALLLALGIGWLQAREEHKRQQTPTSYAEAAKNDAERACVGTDPRAVFVCVNEKVKTAYQTARDEQDLSAQQRAASSALATAVFSFFALTLSGVGVWYVKRTLDATLEAVQDTGKATKAMERQNELAEAETRLALRPYVWFGKMEIRNVGGGKEPEFHVDIGHAGQTPALEIRSFVSLGFLDVGVQDANLRFERRQPGSSVSRSQMFPNHPGLDGDYKLGRKIDDEMFNQLANGQRKFIVAGIVSYRDVFGKRHLTTFKCVSLAFITASVMSTSPCSRGNNAS